MSDQVTTPDDLRARLYYILPACRIEVLYEDSWYVRSSRPITLRQLKAVEALIGHDKIDLVPATYEAEDPDADQYDTPAAGFEEGYLRFAWPLVGSESGR